MFEQHLQDIVVALESCTLVELDQKKIAVIA
jgi:hypothetical protein